MSESERPTSAERPKDIHGNDVVMGPWYWAQERTGKASGAGKFLADIGWGKVRFWINGAGYEPDSFKAFELSDPQPSFDKPLTSPAAPSPEVKPFTPTKSTWQAGVEFKSWLEAEYPQHKAQTTWIAKKALKIFSECGTSPPEVIEGRGQEAYWNAGQVTYWQKRLAKCRDGIYPLRFGCSDTASGGITITDDSVNVWDVLLQLYRDAELLRDFANEILPPRPAFVAPEKPELTDKQIKQALADAGIDMEPAYRRLRKMISDAKGSK